jgi:hypothetical protein
MKHAGGGNCWKVGAGVDMTLDGAVDDVCVRHEEPRGECSECPRCPLCDSEALSTELQKLPPAPKTITIQPTASKTDRFLACAYPWGKTVIAEGEVDAAARFGSAFHEGLALHLANGPAGYTKNAAKFGSDINPQAVEDRVRNAFTVVSAWLGGENPWGINFTRWGLHIEQAFAYNIETGEARWCDAPDESHEYIDRQENELPGTADIIGFGAFRRNGSKTSQKGARNFILILDHKSGWAVGSPRESGQLRSLALAGCRLYGVDRAIVAFLHAPADMAPTVYADTLDAAELNDHATALKAALERVKEGWIKPGPHCKWCQAFTICPTNAKALLDIRGMSAMQTAEDVGLAHARLTDFRRRFADIDAVIDAEIRAWVAKNGAALRPDGFGVDFVERDYTNLSQASIVRALGKLEGGKMIARLKKLGCIETSTRRELRVIK